jgi:hypothetical protein
MGNSFIHGIFGLFFLTQCTLQLPDGRLASGIRVVAGETLRISAHKTRDCLNGTNWRPGKAQKTLHDRYDNQPARSTSCASEAVHGFRAGFSPVQPVYASGLFGAISSDDRTCKCERTVQTDCDRVPSPWTCSRSPDRSCHSLPADPRRWSLL